VTIAADIEEVTTEDVAPTASPYRISAKAGKDTLTFKVNVTATGAMRAIRARFKPLNRNSGKLLYSRGMVCGSGDRCGSPVAKSLAHSSPFLTGTITIKESEVNTEPDGEYEVDAWAMEAGSWSS
jgi:hypothetical protein